MILGADGKKLSKRHGATAVGDYQDQGILPRAMRNFLALLGWSPGGDREIMTESEMIELFSLEGIQKKPAVFDTTKLEWMNGQYLSALPAGDLLEPTLRQLDIMGIQPNGKDILPLIDAVKTRSRTILDVATQVAVRLQGPKENDEKAAKFIQAMGLPNFQSNLQDAYVALGKLDSWSSTSTLQSLKDVAEAKNKKLGDVMQPVRIVLTGSTVSEPVNELLAVIGREESLSRIRSAASR
jgi:glutamyl-tRNA synthetase